MTDFKLDANTRTSLGKNKVSKLRDQKIIPAIVYIRGSESTSVQINERELEKIYSQAGTSNIVDLNIDGKVQPVLFKEVQKHPFKNKIIHVDFHGVRMDEAIKLQIPIVLVGRDEIRLQPSVLTHFINEVEIECLPGDIPHEAKVSVIELQYGDVITVKDLDVSSNDKITILTDEDEVVATLSEPREESLEEEVAISAGEVPTIGESKEKTEER